tara:strand:+ start:1184 stop:1927 length:744 start_codon:yes stop_codon:yes gene_type:complete
MTINKENGIYGIPVLEDNIIWIWVENKSVIVIDPSIAKPVINWIKEKNLKLEYILQTHHHIDHIGGTEELLNQWPNVKIIASKKDRVRIPLQNISVNDGDKINILNKKFKIIELKGHTSTHISFYSNDFQNPILFVGDTLFSGGCGRIFEGTNQQMYNSLKRILTLPTKTIIYCAHEYTKSNLLWALNIYPYDKKIKKKLSEVEKKICSHNLTVPTTLGEEMNINLFLRAKSLREFSYLRAKKDAWV